jgi:hypothetical protein
VAPKAGGLGESAVPLCPNRFLDIGFGGKRLLDRIREALGAGARRTVMAYEFGLQVPSGCGR